MFLILFNDNFMTVVTSSSHFVYIWISFQLAAGHHALSSAHKVFCMPKDTNKAVNSPHFDASWCHGSETSRFATFFNSFVPRRKTLADTHTAVSLSLTVIKTEKCNQRILTSPVAPWALHQTSLHYVSRRKRLPKWNWAFTAADHSHKSQTHRQQNEETD